MTEPNPTPKPRSAFLPVMLVVVGLAIVAGVVLVFVPMVECEVCLGAQNVTFHEYTTVQLENGLSRPFRGAGEPFDPGDSDKTQQDIKGGRNGLSYKPKGHLNECNKDPADQIKPEHDPNDERNKKRLHF